jgi:hypothetical protein
MYIIFYPIFGFLYGLASTILFEFVLKTNKTLRHKYYWHHNSILGYHVHHSSYGILFMLAGLIVRKNDLGLCLFLIMFGIGIVAQHTLSANRFVFIEKDKPKPK